MKKVLIDIWKGTIYGIDDINNVGYFLNREDAVRAVERKKVSGGLAVGGSVEKIKLDYEVFESFEEWEKKEYSNV